jgi:2-oxo-4-hydroxy-4-carboxy--5-ureidoimidazoline (OHCU) decarboxylase
LTSGTLPCYTAYRSLTTSVNVMKRRNFVAKYARVFNHARVHADRKKAAKRGYRKHKGANG